MTVISFFLASKKHLLKSSSIELNFWIKFIELLTFENLLALLEDPDDTDILDVETVS
jgi:hypothetical protein